MNPTDDDFRKKEIRKAIIRHIRPDLLRVLGMWLIPLFFLFTNPWAWHWLTFVIYVSIGVLVIGGTMASLSGAALLKLPDTETGVWTPKRSICYVLLYLALWTTTYFVLS